MVQGIMYSVLSIESAHWPLGLLDRSGGQEWPVMGQVLSQTHWPVMGLGVYGTNLIAHGIMYSVLSIESGPLASGMVR
jgi:hypothetical protein